MQLLLDEPEGRFQIFLMTGSHFQAEWAKETLSLPGGISLSKPQISVYMAGPDNTDLAELLGFTGVLRHQMFSACLAPYPLRPSAHAALGEAAVASAVSGMLPSCRDPSLPPSSPLRPVLWASSLTEAPAEGKGAHKS